MNKLLYVNIGGVVFQIDETAYHKLDQYLNSIRKKYENTEGGDEIIHDIEIRIAELFSEKVPERNAISSAHIDEIISIMGAPEEYENEQKQNYSTYDSSYERRRASRFYRDTDNRILGGVCAGFAARFDIDALWIRIAFLVLFFVVGSGFLLYIILWIIMPDAKTTAEKLEMRGENINISNIERTIKEEAGYVKKKVEHFGAEVKEQFSDEQFKRTKKNLGSFIESTAETLKPMVYGILKFFAGIFAVGCLIILIVLGVELLSDSAEINAQINFLNHHIIGNGIMAGIFTTAIFGLIVIPALAIIFHATKFILGIKKRFKPFGWVMSTVWTLCLAAVIFISIKTGFNFRHESAVSERMLLVRPSTNIMYLQMNSLHEENIIWKRNYREEWDDIMMHDDSLIFRDIEINIEKSIDTNYAVIITKIAKGKTPAEAKQRASNFEFTIAQQDSLLLIPASTVFKPDELWRDQEIQITVRVPENNMVVIDRKAERYFEYNEERNGLEEDLFFGTKLMMTNTGLKPI